MTNTPIGWRSPEYAGLSEAEQTRQNLELALQEIHRLQETLQYLDRRKPNTDAVRDLIAGAEELLEIEALKLKQPLVPKSAKSAIGLVGRAMAHFGYKLVHDPQAVEQRHTKQRGGKIDWGQKIEETQDRIRRQRAGEVLSDE